MSKHKNMVQELLSYDSDDDKHGSKKLTDWEIRFLEDIEDVAKYLSTGQQHKLTEIWQRIFG